MVRPNLNAGSLHTTQQKQMRCVLGTQKTSERNGWAKNYFWWEKKQKLIHRLHTSVICSIVEFLVKLHKSNIFCSRCTLHNVLHGKCWKYKGNFVKKNALFITAFNFRTEGSINIAFTTSTLLNFEFALVPITL